MTGQFYRRKLWFLLFGLAALCALSAAYIYGARLNGPPIRSDGLGYYAYLPALFIDHDLAFRSFAHRSFEGSIEWYGIRLLPERGTYVDKYPIGTAVLEAPFFMIADLLAVMSGATRDGMSGIYQISNITSGAFYFISGVYILWLVLIKFYRPQTALWCLLVIVFGSNVFHYGTYDASFSHIYSFFLVSAYLFSLLNYHDTPRLMWAVLAGIMLGATVITRVPNAILGLLALGSWADVVRTRGLRHWSAAAETAAFAASLAIMLSPQILYLYFATGDFIIYSYQGERFFWGHPQIVNFLFSVRKGLVFWMPLILLSVFGFGRMRPELRYLAISGAACVMLQIYICSSWGTWAFGGSFGSRPFVEFMPLLALPMAATLEWLEGQRHWKIARAVIVALVALNIIMMHSYWRGFIPFDGTTVKEIAALPVKYYRLLFGGPWTGV